MSKRKRSSESNDLNTSNRASKAASHKNPSVHNNHGRNRRGGVESDDLHEVVDLEADDDEPEAAANIGVGVSASKKKRMEKAKESRTMKKDIKLDNRQPSTSLTPPLSAEPVSEREPEVFCSAASNIRSTKNGDGNSNSQYLTPSDSEPLEFKRPGVPLFKKPYPPVLPGPSSSSHQTVVVGEKMGPTEKQLQATQKSREMRKAIIDVLQATLEDASKCSIASVPDLLENFLPCIKRMSFIFASRRYPGQRDVDDLSGEDEISDLARWWLFGMTALLFSTPADGVKKMKEAVKYMIRTVCQFLCNGHPKVVDSIIPLLINVIRDLTVRGDNDQMRVLKLDLPSLECSSSGPNSQKSIYNIQLTVDNEWAIPHFMQSISAVLPRIFFYHFHLRHVLVELLNRFLSRQSCESVETAVTSYSSPAMPAIAYLTEDCIVSLIQRLVESPSLPGINLHQLSLLVGQHGTTFDAISEDIGMNLLPLVLPEYLHSKNFSLLYHNENTVIIADAFRSLMDTVPIHHSQIISCESIKFSKLVSLAGLNVILNPLLEKILLAELENESTGSGPNFQANWSLQHPLRIVKVWEVSQLWSKIMHQWESSLYTVSSHGTPNHEGAVNFMKRSSVFIKLAKNLWNGVYPLLTTKRVRFIFFELKHLQRWFSSRDGYEIHLAILETMESFHACNWLGIKLSPKVLTNLISIPGWPWIANFDAFLPQKYKPLHSFTRLDVSNIIGSKVLVAKSIRVLGSEVFRPWTHFVTEVYSYIINAESTLANSVLVIELLDMIADVRWPFKQMPIKIIFTFVAQIVNREEWKVNSGLRTSLANAIVALPCLCCSVNLGGMNPGNEFSIIKSGCHICSRKQENLANMAQPSIPDYLTQRIASLASPLLRSKFLLVKFQLSDLIVRFASHSEKSSTQVTLPFMHVVVTGKVDLSENVFQKIGVLLTQVGNLNNPCEYRLGLAQQIFTSLRRLMVNSTSNRKISTNKLSKVLKGFFQLATYPLSLSVFVELVKCIVFFLSQTDKSEVTILCQKIVAKYASVYQCQPFDLIVRIRQDLSREIIKVATKAFFVPPESRDYYVNVQQCADFLARLFLLGEFRYGKMFISYYYPAMLEKMVPKLPTRYGYRFLLSAMASHSKQIEQAVLQDWVMLYYPTLLLDHNSETVSTCLQFLKNHYGFVAIFAAKQQEQRILNEALCRLSDQREKLLRCLPHLCKFDEDSSQMMYNAGTSKAMSILEIQELLSKRLLGFFLHLDTKLQSRIETVESKKKILRSFTSLLDLMKEKKITPLRSKVYKTLSSMTKEGPEYFKELFDAWKVFADNLDAEHFGPMASQILAAVLPLRNSPLRNDVDCLISHFVVFKKKLTEPHYHELYFLIEHLKKGDNEDTRTKSEKAKVINAVGGKINEMKNNWLEYFMMIVKESSHENVHIRYQAFSKLLDVFRHESSNFENKVLTRGQMHVSQVISALLAGLRGDSSNEKLKTLIIECLGNVGALDPVRFRSEDDDLRTKSRCTTYSGQMTTFAVLYLQELIREFQEAKDTTSFDYCACLIQQVLQEFKVFPTNEDPIWSCISPASQHHIMHLLTTKYQMDTTSPPPTVYSPIYLSEHGLTFDSWLLNWLTVLISCITTEELRAHSLFNKNKYLLRRNPRIAAFIIPYVTMYAIFCGNAEQREEIVREIITVLERWTVLDAMKVKAHSTVPIKDSQTEFGVKEELSVENESVFHFRCTQVIFSVLDHLLRSFKLAKRKWGLKLASERSRGPSSKTIHPPMSEVNMKNIEAVLEKIPANLISQVAFDCGSYTIALYYLEQELRTNPSNEKLQRNLGYLQRIYVSLNDMDSVIGIAAVRDSDPSLCEIVLENIAKWKMEDCVRNLEKMTANDPSDLIAHNALVQAYLNLDEPRKADTLIRGTIQKRSEWELAFQDVQLESLVKLKNWPELNTLVGRVEMTPSSCILDDTSFTWNTDLVRTISKIQQMLFNDATEIVERIKSKMIAPLVAASEEMYPYKRAYHNVVQLHILTEMEDAIKLLQTHLNYIASGKGQSTQGKLFHDVKRMMTRWDARFRNVSKSMTVIDQILNVRKCLFEIMKTTFHTNGSVCEVLNSAIRECWLDVARDASKCGNFIRADNCLMEAKKFMSPKVLIEEAKILSRKGEKEHAISVLQKGIALYFPQKDTWKEQSSSDHASSYETLDARILCSKALLLLAKLCEEEKLLNMEDYIAKYKEASDVYRDSEKNYFTLGSYHDRLWSSTERRENHFHIQATVVRYYSQSLLYGCKYVYQSLPRLLSIWFDFAAALQSGEYSKVNSSSSKSASSSSSNQSNDNIPIMKPEDVLEIMAAAIKRMVAGIPAYILITAFSQLISRLCHSHRKTWTDLREIIVSIICAHPHQTLWMIMAVTKSLNSQRKKRCLEIYTSVEKTKSELKPLIRSYTELTAKFLAVSDYPIERNKGSLTSVCPSLPNMIRNSAFGKVSIPFQIFLNPSLPRVGNNHKEHEPFPESLVYIEDIEDNIDVMPSLIRPKKLTLRASNGKSCGLMCKPKDDLRKDSKVMEVNNVVNWYLNQITESSQRRLHVRTFSVVPLNEECGLLEWVPNLQGLRPILLSLYKEKNITPNNRDLRCTIELHDTLEVKMEKFVEKMVKPHPPVFHEWFFNNFNDHQSWYEARMAYIRTTAVMSVVGYIMGLGDRHGENILVDSATGETVHVDFNCLFNKGETFEWVERVPFRLTQNMIDAMGPLGYEGVFRRSCEIVMNMFREHKSVFLSVLRPFVFDPLVEWNRNRDDRRGCSSAAGQHGGELTNEKAVETMKYIRNRLNGTARNLMRDINTELSVEAQVKYLIDEATSIENLCQMYIGWAAFF
ncbi:Serine/threonine-protein kinase atr [Orchesella cincta]|uniref:Serine/threonine-protein kinase ATR n=1 Tax=Orchesella cincta TaxID=48709 RepID=A0A1D2NE23_ORCCI|nr:Serine/threonine-protein kinase atr [Orchesella cincta]